jgi:hypothetical protein
MVTAITVKEKIQGLIDKSNNTTGNSNTTLTDAVDALVEGYGAGGAAIIEPITITENGIYEVPEPVLEWDTDWKFKEKIPAQAFEEIFATYPEDIFHDISLHIGSTEKWDISIGRATNENGYFGNLITLPDNKCVYLLECADNDTFKERCYICFDGWTEEEFTALNEAIIATDNGPTMAKGWCTRDYDNKTHYASSAPTISAVPESFTSIDLALLSALFELEKIDGYGPVTVAVAPTVEPITITENGVYPVPKGQGVPEFGTDWKFKEKITIADIEAVVRHYELIDGSCNILWEDPFGISITKIDIANETDNEFSGTIYQVMYDPRKTGMISELCMYFTCDASQETIEALISRELLPPDIDVWTTGGSNVVVMDIPPIIESVPESTGINPEHVAPLFDVPRGKALDGWGDITVNVAGGDKKALQYGKFAKFKDNITDQMFEEYVAQATPVANDPFWGDIYLLCLDESRCAWLIGNNPDVGGWTIMDPAQVRMYMTG